MIVQVTMVWGMDLLPSVEDVSVDKGPSSFESTIVTLFFQTSFAQLFHGQSRQLAPLADFDFFRTCVFWWPQPFLSHSQAQ